MASLIPPHYNDGNRAFLQALMARGALTFEDAKPIIAAIFTINQDGERVIRPDEITMADFEGYLETASDVLSHFDYEIRSIIDQVSNERVYALVNVVSDPLTQLATTYSADEIAFLRRVLDAMFEKYNSQRMEIMCITELQATQLARPPRRSSGTAANVEGQSQATGSSNTDKGLKHSEVERMLANLVAEGWFEKGHGGLFRLSSRALVELRGLLIENFNDPEAGPDEWQPIKFCDACKEIVTFGQRCGNPTCNIRLHDICEDVYWRTHRGKTCPRCSQEWTGTHFVGERAVTTTEAYQRSRRRSGGGRRGNQTEEIIRTQRDDGSDEDME
jgi:non-structural maintenance of chromosomes element 1